MRGIIEGDERERMTVELKGGDEGKGVSVGETIAF